MYFKVCITLIFLSVFITKFILAQDFSVSNKLIFEVPEVALLCLTTDNIETSNSLSASPVEASNILNILNSKQNERIWINYSSIIRENNHQRKIVAVLQGNTPDGIRLIVEASDASGSGNGKLGGTKGEVTLSNQPTDIITGIGSCYTGKGIGNGHYLSYRIEYENITMQPSTVTSENTSFNVIYTLTDNN